MEKTIENEKIKKLLLDGFDKELIAFELDLPLDDIDKLSQEIEAEKKANNKGPNKKQKKQKNKALEKLRKKYKEIYLETRTADLENHEETLEISNILIDFVLISVKKILDEMPDFENSASFREKIYERRAKAKEILDEIKKIQNYPLSVEVAETFYYLLQSEKLKNLNIITDNQLDSYIKQTRRKIIFQLAKAIDDAYMQTNDIEKLEELKSKITLEMLTEEPVTIGALPSKILQKITMLKQQKAKEEMKSKIPDEIQEIVIQLANGTLDIEKAKTIIDEQIRRSISAKSDDQKSLSQNQFRKNYLVYIADSLIEHADKYYIESPELAMRKLQELSMSDGSYALKIIVDNLIQRKEYERARNLCDSIDKTKISNSEFKALIKLKKEVEGKEMGAFVLATINMSDEEPKAMQYFELIKSGVEKGKINLKTVYLGKTQDGLRTITLADVWPPELQMEV